MIRYAARERCESMYRRARDSGLDDLAANVVARRVQDFAGDMSPVFEPSLRTFPIRPACPM